MTLLVVLFLLPFVIEKSKEENRPSIVITLVGTGLGVVYFAQKQRLEELRLFQELFTQFNRRYQELHARLQAIVSGEGPLTRDEQETLVTYFNLCAEEYLLFCEGRILPRVWQVWCRGILDYLACQRINDFWNREVAPGNYYGLNRDWVETGCEQGTAENRA
ncbi:MAG: hypothetical protein ABGY75_20055 [Gemmataceae bacterium]